MMKQLEVHQQSLPVPAFKSINHAHRLYKTCRSG